MSYNQNNLFSISQLKSLNKVLMVSEDNPDYKKLNKDISEFYYSLEEEDSIDYFNMLDGYSTTPMVDSFTQSISGAFSLKEINSGNIESVMQQVCQIYFEQDTIAQELGIDPDGEWAKHYGEIGRQKVPKKVEKTTSKPDSKKQIVNSDVPLEQASNASYTKSKNERADEPKKVLNKEEAFHHLVYQLKEGDTKNQKLFNKLSKEFPDELERAKKEVSSKSSELEENAKYIVKKGDSLEGIISKKALELGVGLTYPQLQKLVLKIAIDNKDDVENIHQIKEGNTLDLSSISDESKIKDSLNIKKKDVGEKVNLVKDSYNYVLEKIFKK